MTEFSSLPDGKEWGEDEKARFVGAYILDAEGRQVIPVLRTFRPQPPKENLTIMPRNLHPLGRFGEQEEYDFVFTAQPETHYKIVVSSGEVGFVHYVSYSLGAPAPLLKGCTFALADAHRARPQVYALPHQEMTDDSPIRVRLPEFRWAKIIAHSALHMPKPYMPDLLHFSEAQRDELMLPARWMRAVDDFLSSGQSETTV